MIKLLSDIFYKEIQSIKYIRRSRSYKILFNICVCLGVIGLFVLIFSPIIMESDRIRAIIPINIGYVIINLAILLSSIISLISSFGYIYSSGYLDKNLERYLYMPIKSKDFTIAKFFFTYQSTLLIVALCMVPALIMGIVFSGFDLWMIVTVIFYTLTIPIFTGLIAVIVIGTLMIFLNKVENKSFAKNALYSVFTVLIAGLSLTANLLLSRGGQDPLQMMNLVSTILSIMRRIFIYPVWALEIFNLGHHINFLWMTLLLIVAGVIGLTYFNYVYYKGAVGFASDTSSSKGVKFKDDQVKSRGLFSWFFLMEFKQIFKTSVYFFNTVFSSILIVVIYLGMMGFAYFSGQANDIHEVIALIEEHLSIPLVFLIAVIVTLFMGFMSTGAGTVYSREKNNLDAFKTMPINFEFAFLGKVAFHLLIEFISTSILIVLPMVIVGVNPIYILAALLGVIATLVATALTGVNIDLIFPTLNWESETSVVKRSKSIFINMVVSMVICVIFGLIIGFGLFRFDANMTILTIIALVLLGILFTLNWIIYKKEINKAFS